MKISIRLILTFFCFFFPSTREFKAEVFFSQEEALTLAFKGEKDFEKVTRIFTEADLLELKNKFNLTPASKLLTYFIQRRTGVIAIFDKQPIRTKDGVFLSVLEAQGNGTVSLKKIVVLAFFEPGEYLPAVGWLEKFSGISSQKSEELHDIIPPIAGSTLTVNSVNLLAKRNLDLISFVFMSQGI